MPGKHMQSWDLISSTQRERGSKERKKGKENEKQKLNKMKQKQDTCIEVCDLEFFQI